MRMMDLLVKKRDGQTLSNEEIQFLVKGYTEGTIPDYQMSAFLMAVYLNGMDARETAALTLCMAHSGGMMDLSSIPGVKVDKHSTGGVGDKTTLIIGPIVAACGIPVAKMSGRGLGHTGGTVDKLESIPGYQVGMEMDAFLEQVRRIGIALVGQTGNLAPADKKLYALRDVTGTVESIPLIAASIMSKKIAAGADAILLDVKVGSGAFMKTKQDAQKLADAMVAIGEEVGRKTFAMLTNMDMPLGHAIGNALEVIEAIDILHGRGDPHLTELCLALSAKMLELAGKGNETFCRKLAEQTIADGSAFQKLRELVQAQGGDVSVLDNPDLFELSPVVHEYRAQKDGYITHINTEQCGIAACVLGAGRERKEDSIDYGAGIILRKNYGDKVTAGDVIATLYTAQEAKLADAERLLDEAFLLDEKEPAPASIIL